MKKLLLILFVTVGFSSLFAGVTVKDYFGKVKVKYDGDTQWSSIEVGQELPAKTLVSTGFNSQIVLDLGNALLDVLPLTRMTVSEITESQDTIKTTLFLNGGKLKADVGKIEGKANDFKIKSPVATASVRGTAFEFSGNTLKVIRGKVAFIPNPRKESNKDGDKSEDSEEEDDEESDDEATDSDGDSGAGIAVEAGGATEMASASAAIVPPSSIAQASASVSASTKPTVIKTTSASTPTVVSSTVEDIPTATEVLAETSTVASVTVTFTVTED